jgi:hypothetical protein
MVILVNTSGNVKVKENVNHFWLGLTQQKGVRKWLIQR